MGAIVIVREHCRRLDGVPPLWRSHVPSAGDRGNMTESWNIAQAAKWRPMRINLARRMETDKPILFSGYVPAGHRLLSISALRKCRPVDQRALRANGVYFLWEDRRLLYVGSSADVLPRVMDHLKAGRIGFDYATFLAVEFPWYLSIEAAYIAAYLPASNRTHTPHPRGRR